MKKADDYQLPLRNVYENLALMIFMTVLFMVSLMQEANAQATEPIRHDSDFQADFEFKLDTFFLHSAHAGARLAAYLHQHQNFQLRTKMSMVGASTRLPLILGRRSNLGVSPIRSSAVIVEHVRRTESELSNALEKERAEWERRRSNGPNHRLKGLVCGLGAVAAAFGGTLLALQGNGFWSPPSAELTIAGTLAGSAAFGLISQQHEPSKGH